MKNPITRLSSAAAVGIAVAVGTMYLGTPIDRTSVVSAETIHNHGPLSPANWLDVPRDDPPDISWLRDIEDLEYIHWSRKGVSIVLRKQFSVNITAFQLQCNWDDLEDFYEKLNISFIGTSNGSPGSCATIGPEAVRHVFALAESTGVFALRARSTVKAGNSHKCLLRVSNLGSAVLGPLQRHSERHVDLSFSFFPYTWLESAETPGATRASVDIPRVRIDPGEALLMRYADPAGVAGKDGRNAQDDAMERIVMLLVQIADVQTSTPIKPRGERVPN